MKTACDSLTILLLARNAQTKLARDVERLIDAAAELTSRFELLIVDDGSRDATEEIAWELTARYSQVRLVRHPRPLGMLAAYRAVLAHTSGEYVVVHDCDFALRCEGLSMLWRRAVASRESRAVASRAAPENPCDDRPGGSLARLLASVRGWWSPRDVSPGEGRMRLLRRSELRELDPLAEVRPPTYLERVRQRRSAGIR